MGVPLAVRVVVAVAVVVFVYGTAVHLDQLAAGGWHPYRELPGWLAGYFVSLTVLDPVAAGLLACRRRAGAGLRGLAVGCGRQRLCELRRPLPAGHHCGQGRSGCRHGARGRPGRGVPANLAVATSHQQDAG